MDTKTSQQLDVVASELSLSDLSPATINEGDHSLLSVHAFFQNPGMDQTLFQQQYSFADFPAAADMYAMNQDQCQVWSTTQVTQQTFVEPTPTPQSSVARDYVPLAKRPSNGNSVHSAMSDGEELTENSNHDEASERRRERRRAQNRAAQRAFRARKEETIKESSVRLEALQDELTRLQSANGCLSETVQALKSQIKDLQSENTQLKRQSRGNSLEWENFDMGFVDATMTAKLPPRPALSTDFSNDSNDSGVFDMTDPSPRDVEDCSPNGVD